MNTIQQILTRLQTESPALYKKLQNIAGIICLLATIGLSIVPLFTFPQSSTVMMILGGVIAFFGGVGLTAKTTTVDSRLMDKKSVGNVIKYEGTKIATDAVRSKVDELIDKARNGGL